MDTLVQKSIYKYIPVYIDECAICLESLEDNLKILKCRHQYHQECIYKWSIKENSCPECRTFFDFSTNNQKDLLEWTDIKLYNLNIGRFTPFYKKLSKIVEIANILIIHSEKGIKCHSSIYKKLLDTVEIYKNDLKFSFCKFLFFGLISIDRDYFMPPYGWYERTVIILRNLSEDKLKTYQSDLITDI